MNNSELTIRHDVYFAILKSRNKTGLSRDEPLWKLKLSDTEYKNLKQVLRDNHHQLKKFGEEAALCYAEWWRRDYNGNIPSKEDVAIGLGLSEQYSEDLYKTARNALEKRGFTFIRSLKGTEYFRTLLNQGGLPVNYIITNDSNLGTFSRFLKGLVRELSAINYDWSSKDNSIIQQFNCISYLGRAFKNENIYDVSMQIAHAIITGNSELLPYDAENESLLRLTNSLKREYTAVQHERRTRPLSLNWKLKTGDNERGYLFVNMDVVKDISSDSIPGLDINTCYVFDAFVAGTIVGKYVRKTINHDIDGKVINATYTRISTGMSKDILWRGEPVVEVKIRCDNDQRIFLTIAGCYPPNFEQPQVFQMLDENIYIKNETANSENNIAIFTDDWNVNGVQALYIGEQKLSYEKFTRTLDLKNKETGEEVTLTSQFTPYTAEFSGNYISWVENSNYKLLSNVPIIHVYDKDKMSVNKVTAFYRSRKTEDRNWYRLNHSCTFPNGLVDIRVEFPDGQNVIETFYAVGNLSFCSSSEQALSTEITCNCDKSMRAEIETNDYLNIEKRSENTWKISRRPSSNICPSVCDFSIYIQNNPTLRLSVAIPFDGIIITDLAGNIVPYEKIISFSNLANFCIISHGKQNRSLNISYKSERFENERMIHLKSNVIDGLVSLSDYGDMIDRMFNIYGANSFDRSSSVVYEIPGKKVYVRKFVLETEYKDGMITVTDDTEPDTNNFLYEGSLYAFPVDEFTSADNMSPITLTRKNEDENVFCFPKDYAYKEVIIFSGPEARRRVIPKYHKLDEEDLDIESRIAQSKATTKEWMDNLLGTDGIKDNHWNKVCMGYKVCSHYNLPFTTYNGLKAIVTTPKLLAKFIIAMWLNELKEIFIQDIDRFEQEMEIAVHWIPAYIWKECIDELLNTTPVELIPIMLERIQNNLLEWLHDIINTTLSAEIASEFTRYITSDTINGCEKFHKSDIQRFQMKIHGISDLNTDLPIVTIQLQGTYYQPEKMRPFYEVMIKSAMCAAENTCSVSNRVNIFSEENKKIANIVNFYRKYFKETYSEIFLRTVKIIKNQNI